MKIAVVGTGNVGSALLFHLADLEGIAHVLVMNIKEEWSHAAIMDMASAFPDSAQHFSPAPYSSLSEAHIVFMTSGIQMKHNEKGQDVYEKNLAISLEILSHATLKHDAILIALATPVDKLTSELAENLSLPASNIIGFGGDLDRHRLQYVLDTYSYITQEIHVVGEHGENIIPIFDHEREFQEIKQQVSGFLAAITAQGGSPRNLATGLLLAKLAHSIVNDLKLTHYVCGYHPTFNRYLTWPFPIGRSGVGPPLEISIGPKAEEALKALLGENWANS